MQYSFSKRIQSVESSAVRDILKLTQGKSIISFAGGLPAEEWFPVDAIRTASERVFRQGPQALQYGLTEGTLSLRERLAARMGSQRNIQADAEELLISSGSQQAIDLFARAILDPGDVVLVENPTYLACLQVLGMYNARVIPVESDDNGMVPEDLVAKLKQHQPKFVYVVPTFGNPTGRVWSLERREALLRLCREHEVLILEDDPYGDLRFTSERVPNIAALEGRPEDRIVAYTSTFSKTVAPGLRTGWIVADKRIIRMMARAKQSSDLHSSVLDQLILSEMLLPEVFKLDDHIHKLSAVYKERMETMATELQKEMWRDSKWNTPQGGMFFWVELPEGLDAQTLLTCAVEKGVAFVPGTSFYAGEPKRNTMRLNFSFAQPETIRTGMERLTEAVSEFFGRYSGV
ncbi:aminotransferase-like domain-containing protein [Paenibacillus apiarius]|uniref:PLP-dependent aminotransferase family protein n=1 Tax=Paenibacillus apiarius TaxID=46240 RepID=A0ABT4DXE3_9BACL|nr:PLP-dependent aminotransferase family protein [Paenibacillus apiarius]MCY9515215.1 PLP-dependent aminotransferase family protein [Paenibacillus apiarius]MCY9520621.1 PLP-dependent aminotransferase family protein [Paenibacillus apiarius]MCY9550423.1 PLP-dependent aminotransferase family protein [Paenibacillus apiarius]MCY9561481.1 PLP-dependent aminotransferase family protein [Paenibacillus apiarius]MCY9685585.1 PLP-dependent aminotransferase family protein [Paenibacillus apiarius]